MNYFMQSNYSDTKIVVKCTDTGVRDYLDFNYPEVIRKDAFGTHHSKEECIRIHGFIPLSFSHFINLPVPRIITPEVREFIKGYLEECVDN